MMLISKDRSQEYKYSYVAKATQDVPRGQRLVPSCHDPLRKYKLSFDAFKLKYRSILARIHEECVRNARLFSARNYSLNIDEAGLRDGLYKYLYDTFDKFDTAEDHDICMPE